MNKTVIVSSIFFAVGLVLVFFSSTKLASNNRDFAFEYSLQCAQLTQLGKNEEIIPFKVFYSPKLKTCIGAFAFKDPNENGVDKFYINNLLTNESIFSEMGQKDDSIDGISLAKIAEEKYLKKLSEVR